MSRLRRSTALVMVFALGATMLTLARPPRSSAAPPPADWQRINHENGPPGRGRHSLAYDATRDEIVLFGGGDSGGQMGDTWTSKAGVWTREEPAHSPTKRWGAALVYIPGKDHVLLFGG